ncbi:MAG: hypothetical protein RBQ70_02925 [Acholeplasma sp.]|jgi:hypothetical protein|nr:hypothetical protein [Acholeplasma sp.]
MARRVLFIVISLVLLAVVYITSLTGIIVERQSVTLERILSEATESGDYTNYVKYSSEMYKPLFLNVTTEDNRYEFQAFQTIESSKTEMYAGFIIFVKPVLDVPHSMEQLDDLDLSDIVINKDTTIVYDSKDDSIYDEFSISYGIEERAFYYYNFVPDTFGNFEVTIKNYEGDVILSANTLFVETTLDINPNDAQAKEDLFIVLSQNGFLRSYTIDEINALYEFDQHVWKAYMYSAIFLVIDLSVGYFFVFKKKQ